MRHFLKSLWVRLATPTPQGQRGIALLLTLGVLSLLLVLAMSFAYTARTERMAASVNADTIKVRELAESAQEQVLAIVLATTNLDQDNNKIYFDTVAEKKGLCPLTSQFLVWDNNGVKLPIIPSIQPCSMNTTTTTPDSASEPEPLVAARRYGIDTLAVNFGTFTYIGGANAMPNTPMPKPTDPGYSVSNLYSWFTQTRDNFPSVSPLGDVRIGWIPVTVDEPDRKDLNGSGTTTDTVRRLIGRYAYIIVNDTGKVDPSALSPNAGNSVGDVAREVALDSITFSSTDMSLINTNFFKQVLYSDPDNADFYTSHDIPQTGRAFSWKNLADAGVTGNRTNVEAIFPNSVAEPVAGRQTLNQFDMSQLWNVDTDDSGATNGVAMVDRLFNEIPWLKNWSDAGTFPSASARAKQIAANIVDYFDDDDNRNDKVYPQFPVPRTPLTFSFQDRDFLPTYSPATGYPDYIGVEQVPLINEMLIKLQNTSGITDHDPDGNPATPEKLWNVLLTVESKSELIFMFPITTLHDVMRMGENCTVEMTVNVVGKYGNGTVGYQEIGPDGPDSDIDPDGIEIQLTPATCAIAMDDMNRYRLTGIGSAVIPSATPISFTGVDVEFKDLQVRIVSAILKRSDGKLWDAARTAQSKIDTAIVLISPGGTGSSIATWKIEVDDPRQNHNAEDWKRSMLVEPTWLDTYWYRPTNGDAAFTGALADKNIVCNPNPGAGNDNEPNANFVKPVLLPSEFKPPTSAYMRNIYPPINNDPAYTPKYLYDRSLVGPCDLGIIHRGAKWETINLCKRSPNTGGGAYSLGDQNILDQVWFRKYSVFSTKSGPMNGFDEAASLEPPYLVRGKINPNAKFNDNTNYPGLSRIGNALFAVTAGSDTTTAYGHPTGQTPEAYCPPGFGDPISSIATVKGIFDGLNSTPLFGPWDDRIGQALYNDTGLNDRVKEVVFLQTKDILSPRWNHFTAVIVAQAIKDIEAPSQDRDEAQLPSGVYSNTNYTDDGDEIGYGYFDTEETLALLADPSFPAAKKYPAGVQPVPDKILAETKLMVSFSVNTSDNGFANESSPVFVDNRAKYNDGRSKDGEFTFLGWFPRTGTQPPPANAHRYYISNFTADNWQDAKRICETMGGNLLCVESEKEWDAFKNGDISVSDDFWLGLYRTGQDNPSSIVKWRWCNGSLAIPGSWLDSSLPASKMGDKAVTIVDSSKNVQNVDVSGTSRKFILECEPRVRVWAVERLEEQ